MDFASLMTAELSKAKPISKSAQTKTYLKRSELEAERDAAYRKEQAQKEVARIDKLERKRKHDEEEEQRKADREEKKQRLAEESKQRREQEEAEQERQRRKRLGLPELPDQAATSEPDIGGQDNVGEDIADEELVAALRKLGEPTRLFGEDHDRRLKRYRKITGASKEVTMSNGPIPTTLQLVPEAEMKVDDVLPTGHEGRQLLFRKLASYFNMVLREWELALSERAPEVASSFQGKQAYNAMVQARENLRPMFKKLEKSEIEDGILKPVTEIVKAAQARRYVDANDGYLRLSIGKAAWPIGVTMVGIHERSAREKLHGSDKDAAHIMSDEITRKYLQSIKRCLSFAQTRWPPDDQMQLMG